MLVKQSGRSIARLLAHPSAETMSHFDFQSYRLLEFSNEDCPTVFFNDDRLCITAERDDEIIMITAPMPQEKAKAPVTRSQVKAPNRKPIKAAAKTSSTLPVTDSRVGENSKLSKLTAAQVTDIKQMLADPQTLKEFKTRTNSYVELAKVYGVHWTTVANIDKRRTWKHVNIEA